MSQPTAFLESLLDAPGPSGFEVRPARVWRAEAETFADSVTTDVSGNTFATAWRTRLALRLVVDGAEALPLLSAAQGDERRALN